MADESLVRSFGLDNDEIRGSLFKKFQGKKGQIDRAGLIYTDPKTMFVGAKVHYKNRYFYCKKSICCEKIGDPRWRIGAVMIKYLTDNLGVLKSPFGYEILPWIFSEQTYTRLRTADSEFPLASHDIKITCTNEDYQNLDINCCKESIWQAKPELKTRILEEAKSCYEWVKKGIASDLSIQEIKDLIDASSSASGATDPTSKMSLEDILKNA